MTRIKRLPYRIHNVEAGEPVLLIRLDFLPRCRLMLYLRYLVTFLFKKRGQPRLPSRPLSAFPADTRGPRSIPAYVAGPNQAMHPTPRFRQS